MQSGRDPVSARKPHTVSSGKFQSHRGQHVPSDGISSKSAFDGTLSNFGSPSVISKAVATTETQRDGVKWMVWLLHVRISEM